jgi:CHAD domain-containing protein
MDDPRVSVHSLARRSLGPAKPVKAQGPYIARAMRPEQAFRAILSDCVAQITANAALLRVGRSVEGLHQLRVAFRRLDVALGAFGREFKQGWLEELRGRAKILSGRLAPARDLDVFVGKLLAGPPDTGGEGFGQLRARAESVRDAAWETVMACITGDDFGAFADDMAALASSQLPLTRQRRLPKTAARMLDRQVARVQKRGKTARAREEGELHRLRIALKKLRYTAEFFAPLYRKKDVKQYLKQLRGLQALLGDLNDVANVRDVVGQVVRHGNDNQSPMCFAAGSVVGWYGAQTPRAAKQALKRYRKFREVTPFWR